MRIILLYLAIWLLLSPTAQASASWQFAPRTQVPNVNPGQINLSTALSVDGLRLFFTMFVGPYNHDIFITTRETVDGEWAHPESLPGDVNSQYYEEAPFLSTDGLSLYFTDGLWFLEVPHRPGSRNGDIWISERESLFDVFGEPRPLNAPVNSEFYDGAAKLSLDELTLVFDSQRPGGSGATDLWVTYRADHESPWQELEPLGPIVNSQYHDVQPALSPDGMSLFFSSNRPGGFGGYDIWVTSRDTIGGEWGEPAPLDENVNSPFNEVVPFLTADGSALYFAATDGPDLTQFPPTKIHQSARLAPEIPGDFDGDGVLSVADVNLVKPGATDLFFDLDDNGLVDVEDRRVWVEDLKNTHFGDVDLDGRVDSRDLNALALHWLAVDATSWDEGDIDGDCNVDAADLNHLAMNWHNGVSPAAAVAEPSSIALLFLSGFALRSIAHRPRKRGPR